MKLDPRKKYWAIFKPDADCPQSKRKGQRKMPPHKVFLFKSYLHNGKLRFYMTSWRECDYEYDVIKNDKDFYFWERQPRAKA